MQDVYNSNWGCASTWSANTELPPSNSSIEHESSPDNGGQRWPQGEQDEEELLHGRADRGDPDGGRSRDGNAGVMPKEESRKLKQLVAEQALDIVDFKAVLSKK
jgi:hypothetical protein